MTENDIRTCEERGYHEYTFPVVVRQGWHILHASVEVAASICPHCGSWRYFGWIDEEDDSL